MLYLVLIAVWAAILMKIYTAAPTRKSRIDNPIILFLGPQLVAIALIPLLSNAKIVIPAIDMDPGHFLYLLIASLLFVGAITLGARRNNLKARTTHISVQISVLGSIIFWICFGTGSIGTLILLSNIGITSFAQFIFAVQSDFNNLESNFFNSSAAILWQANTAAFFWFNVVKRPSWLMKVALIICFVSIMARGALLYIVIALFYYIVSAHHLRSEKKSFRAPLILLIIAINFIFAMSYDFDGSVLQIYFQKSYPYLSGNFTNLFRHIDMTFGRSILEIRNFDDLLQSMGFNSIRTYLDSYFGITYQPYDRMPFYPQASNASVFGNTHSLYGQVVYLPLVILVPFWIGLGWSIGRIYLLSSRSLFYLSIHVWFSAATFLSFAGAGHFNTTRLFPALLFIWPFLLIIKLFFPQKKLLRHPNRETHSGKRDDVNRLPGNQ